MKKIICTVLILTFCMEMFNFQSDVHSSNLFIELMREFCDFLGEQEYEVQYTMDAVFDTSELGIRIGCDVAKVYSGDMPVEEAVKNSFKYVANDIQSNVVGVTGIVKNIFDESVYFVVKAFNDEDEVVGYSITTNPLEVGEEKQYKFVLENTSIGEVDHIDIVSIPTKKFDDLELLDYLIEENDSDYKITSTIQNFSGNDIAGGFICDFYDDKGNIIYTEACPMVFYSYKNKLTKSINIPKIEGTDRIEVRLSGLEEDKDVNLLSSGYRMSDGYIEVTGVIQKAGLNQMQAGIMAVGYDVSGEIVEVGSTGSLLSGLSGQTLSGKIKLKAIDQIDTVKVYPTGNEKVKKFHLLEFGYRELDGRIEVTGVVEKAFKGTKVGGILVEGYDGDGNLVEVTSKAASFYYGKGQTKLISARLSKSKGIEEVKVYATGNQQDNDLHLLTYGVRKNDSNFEVTAVLEKSFYDNPVCGIKAVAYDDNGSIIEEKISKSSTSYGKGQIINKKIEFNNMDVANIVVEPYIVNRNPYLELISYSKEDQEECIKINAIINKNINGVMCGGIMVVGYDSNGDKVEIGIDSSVISYSSVNQDISREVRLFNVKDINDIKVFLIGDCDTRMKDEIELVESSYILKDNKYFVTGVIQKNSTSKSNGGIIAVAYDSSGKEVEIVNVNSEFLQQASGETKLLNLTLDNSDNIDHIKVFESGAYDPEMELEFEVMASSYGINNGKYFINTIIQKNFVNYGTGRVVAKGYDDDNRLIETVSKKIDWKVRLEGGTKLINLEIADIENVSYIKVDAYMD